MVFGFSKGSQVELFEDLEGSLFLSVVLAHNDDALQVSVFFADENLADKGTLWDSNRVSRLEHVGVHVEEMGHKGGLIIRHSDQVILLVVVDGT